MNQLHKIFIRFTSIASQFISPQLRSLLNSVEEKKMEKNTANIIIFYKKKYSVNT